MTSKKGLFFIIITIMGNTVFENKLVTRGQKVLLWRPRHWEKCKVNCQRLRMEGSNKAPCGNGFISFGNKVNVCKKGGKWRDKTQFSWSYYSTNKKYKQIHSFNNIDMSPTECCQNVPIWIEAQTYLKGPILFQYMCFGSRCPVLNVNYAKIYLHICNAVRIS